MSDFDQVEFWDRKILGWEEARYGSRRRRSNSLFDRIAAFQDSVNYRRERACELLQRRISGKRVLELGCGSGLLISDLSAATDATFVGVDFSEAAIERAKERSLDRAEWIVGDVSNLEFPECDVVVGLGLLDWLSHEQIRQLAEQLGDREFLFSFSEDRPSLFKMLHKLYVQISYGRKTGNYRPRYHSAQELRDLFGTQAEVLRERELGFGAFFHNLDGSHELAVDAYFRGRSYNPIMNIFRRKERRAVREFLSDVEGQTVLELGCGEGEYGRLALQMGASRYLGCDRVVGETDLDIVQCDVRDFEAEQFDRVLCCGVLEFLENPEELIGRLPEFVKPGGRVLVFLPMEGLFGDLYWFFHRLKGYNINLFGFRELPDLFERLRALGFRPLSCDHVFFLTAILHLERRE